MLLKVILTLKLQYQSLYSFVFKKAYVKVKFTPSNERSYSSNVQSLPDWIHLISFDSNLDYLPACFVKVFQVTNKAFSLALIYNRILFKYFGHNVALVLMFKKVHGSLSRVHSSEILKFTISRTNTTKPRIAESVIIHENRLSQRQ